MCRRVVWGWCVSGVGTVCEWYGVGVGLAWGWCGVMRCGVVWRGEAW